MTRAFRYLAPLLCVALIACEEQRPLGKCVGLNGVKVPELRYEYSTKNIVVGLLLSETIIVPVVVAFNQLQCPVERLHPTPTAAAERAR